MNGTCLLSPSSGGGPGKPPAPLDAQVGTARSRGSIAVPRRLGGANGWPPERCSTGARSSSTGREDACVSARGCAANLGQVCVGSAEGPEGSAAPVGRERAATAVGFKSGGSFLSPIFYYVLFF